MADKIKFALALLLVAAGVAGFYLLGERQPVWLRVLCVVGGVGLGVVLAWFTDSGRRFVVFANEAVAETKKVVWPTRKETIQTTGVVFAFVVVMALFLMVFDMGVSSLIGAILGGAKS